MAIVHGQVARAARRAGSPPASSRCVPTATGTISRLRGRRRDPAAGYGEWIIDAHLPPPGTPTQPVEAGYMANAWVRMRHPDYDALRGMLDDVGRSVKVHA